MISLNGILIKTLEELEEAIQGFSESEKQSIRNDFNGIPNVSVVNPQIVSPRQMRVALVMSGISLETIEFLINNLPEPQKTITKVTWEYSVEFQRNNPILNNMAPYLGLSSKQIDDLFLLASTL